VLTCSLNVEAVYVSENGNLLGSTKRESETTGLKVIQEAAGMDWTGIYQSLSPESSRYSTLVFQKLMRKSFDGRTRRYFLIDSVK
jgi:hypothetical protein